MQRLADFIACGQGVDEVLRALVKEIRKRRPLKAKPVKVVKAAKEKWTP